MDERELKELLNAEEIPPADANARTGAINLALAAFDDAQREKAHSTQKNRQGFGIWRRLTGRSNAEPGERPMKSRFLYGGMATATAVILAVVTYRTMPIVPEEAFKPAPTATSGAGGRAAEEEQAVADRKSKTEQDKPAATTRRDEALPLVAEPKAAGQSAAPATPPQALADRLLRQSPDVPASRPLAKEDRATSQLGAFSGAAGVAQPGDRLPPAQYEAVGRDQFANVAENTVKRVADDPVSTFSVDVDTASYAFVRRMLMRGVLPQKDAVRVEELINYFDYDYPVPATREQPFQPSVGVMPSPWKEGNKLVRIGIKGYALQPAEKPRSNLVFLLDVSGSMNAADKLPLMVNSMKLLLDSLKADDTVAIVTYAGAAGTVLEPTRAAEKQKILGALDRLTAGGSTAGAAGIRQANALAEGSFDAKAVNRVILATDGDFNVGITNRDELKGFVERRRQSGVFLTVLGFGQGNLNDRLMQELAQNGNGVAAYVDTLSEARKLLVEGASAMLFPIAKDVKIQVEFNPKTVAEYRLIGYETRALQRQDFNNDKVDAGDIGAGHTVTALYEITPVGGGSPLIGDSRYQDAAKPGAATTGVADEYAFLKIRYKLPNEDSSKLITAPISLSQELTGTQLGEAQWAAAAAGFGQILKGGKYTGSFAYDDVIALAQGAKGGDPFGYRADVLHLARLAKSAATLPNR
jgi:Ca-activated chloride channel family protein